MQFNPVAFDPVEWVALAKAAGMKYITITSKHHDGFAMFDSKVSDYNIVARTPYKKDVLKALADECRKQGLKLFFYHSQLDWHHPDYFPRGRTGQDAGRADQGSWPRYLDYMNGQLRELLTNYGEIGGIWFDGWWDRPDADWQPDRTYSLIHQLPPQALIGANHHRRLFPGEDFQMFEKDLPGGKTAEFNKDSEIGDLPLETCETMNGAWGFNLTDRRYKSTTDLIRYLVRAAGSNANFPPTPVRRRTEDPAGTTAEIGAWMAKNEAIYGTARPVAPHPWGDDTQSQCVMHVLETDRGCSRRRSRKDPEPSSESTRQVLERLRRRREAATDAIDPTTRISIDGSDPLQSNHAYTTKTRLKAHAAQPTSVAPPQRQLRDEPERADPSGAVPAPPARQPACRPIALQPVALRLGV